MESSNSKNAFIDAAVKLKIPTILMVGVILYAGYLLLSGSNSFTEPRAVGGGALVVVGVVLAIIGFLDYRNKEQTDAVIGHLHTSLDATTKAVKSLATTNSTYNRFQQDTIKSDADTIGGRGHRKYAIPSSSGSTSTADVSSDLA